MQNTDNETKTEKQGPVLEIIEMCDWCLPLQTRSTESLRELLVKKPIKAEVLIQKLPNNRLFFHRRCLKEILGLIDKELLRD